MKRPERDYQAAVIHQEYRTHPHSPKGCSMCEIVEEILRQQGVGTQESTPSHVGRPADCGP